MADEFTLEADPIDFSSLTKEKTFREKHPVIASIYDGIMKTEKAKAQAKMNTLDGMANGLEAAHNAFMDTDLTASEGGRLTNNLGKKADKILGTTPSDEKPKDSSEKPSEKPFEKPVLSQRSVEIKNWTLNDLTPETYKNSNITAADVINRAKSEGMSGADAAKKLRELSGGQISDKGVAAIENAYGKEFAESLKVGNVLDNTISDTKDNANKSYEDQFEKMLSWLKGHNNDINPHLEERIPHGIIGDYLSGAYGKPDSKEAKMALAYFIADEVGTRLRNISHSIGGGEHEESQYKKMAADRIARATEAYNKRFDAEMEAIIKQMGFTQDEENEITSTLTKLYANERLKPVLQSLNLENKKRLLELVKEYGKDGANVKDLGEIAKAMFMLEAGTNPEVVMKGVEAVGGLAKDVVGGLINKMSLGGILGLK